MVLYPQSRVSDGPIIKELEGLYASGKVSKKITNLETQVIVVGMPPHSLSWIRHGNFNYVHRRPGVWFRCEPIRAHHEHPSKNKIILDTFIAPLPDSDEMRRKGEYSSDAYEKLVQTFLAGLRGEFVNSTIAIPEKLGTFGIIDMFKETAPSQICVPRGLNLGDTVKIKCEGVTGVLKVLDKDNGLATLNIGGRHLKYRFEDIERTQK